MAMDMTDANTKKKKPCGKGRRKVEIRKIEDASSRMVAFSKRKKGLFNKAGELHRLCDANIAVVIQSPSGRLFSFGKPSADQVIDKFLCDASYNHRNKEETEDMEESTDILREVGDNYQNKEETEDMEESTELGGGGGGGGGEEEGVKFWWEESTEGLSLEELNKYMFSLEALRNNVAIKLEEMMMRKACERDLLSYI